MDFHYIFFMMVIAVAGQAYGAAVHTDQVCTWSSECPKGSCCRQKNGTLLISSGVFDHVGPYKADITGLCVPLEAQYGEQCGETCPCDDSQGLKCFRSVVKDNTIAPFTCLDKSYVEEQTEKFMGCFLDPRCQLPL